MNIKPPPPSIPDIHAGAFYEPDRMSLLDRILNRKAKARKHCWHEKKNSRQIRGGANYSRTMVCCYCGKEAFQERKALTVTVNGHGPYVSAQETDWRPALPSGPCGGQR